MERDQKQSMNYLSIGEHTPLRCASANYPLLDGGSSALSALYILEEMLSRLAFDLKLNQELLLWQYFEMMIGTGYGGYVMAHKVDQYIEICVQIGSAFDRETAVFIIASYRSIHETDGCDTDFSCQE